MKRQQDMDDLFALSEVAEPELAERERAHAVGWSADARPGSDGPLKYPARLSRSLPAYSINSTCCQLRLHFSTL